MARNKGTKGVIQGWGISDIKTEYLNEYGDKVRCPYYAKWCDMVMRVHSEKYIQKMPTYAGSSIVDGWQKASDFQVWMQYQPWQGLELDKDVLFVGNKVYFPRHMCFCP